MTGKQEGPYKGEETKGRGRQTVTNIESMLILMNVDVLYFRCPRAQHHSVPTDGGQRACGGAVQVCRNV